jgi:hypothetical protein
MCMHTAMSRVWRNLLPLIEEDRLGHRCQGGICIELERSSLGRNIQPHHCASEPPGARRLASGARADHQQRRQLGEEFLKRTVNQPGCIANRGHIRMLAIWTTP